MSAREPAWTAGDDQYVCECAECPPDECLNSPHHLPGFGEDGDDAYIYAGLRGYPEENWTHSS